MTVLIIEDNAGVRRLLRHAIAGTAGEIWECDDGADALAVYASHRPDVVLMDIRMPGLDGLSATRQICEFDPSARVVIVTDYDDYELRIAAAEAGASSYALKQSLPDLPDVISSVLRKAP